MREGDEVDVFRADGSVAAFAVDAVQKVAKTQFPTSDVYGNGSYPGLRPVTCPRRMRTQLWSMWSMAQGS